jgi:hypothetical protein
MGGTCEQAVGLFGQGVCVYIQATRVATFGCVAVGAYVCTSVWHVSRQGWVGDERGGT